MPARRAATGRRTVNRPRRPQTGAPCRPVSDPALCGCARAAIRLERLARAIARTSHQRAARHLFDLKVRRVLLAVPNRPTSFPAPPGPRRRQSDAPAPLQAFFPIRRTAKNPLRAALLFGGQARPTVLALRCRKLRSPSCVPMSTLSPSGLFSSRAELFSARIRSGMRRQPDDHPFGQRLFPPQPARIRWPCS